MAKHVFSFRLSNILANCKASITEQTTMDTVKCIGNRQIVLSMQRENNQQTHVRFDPFATITDEPRNNHKNNNNTALGNQTTFSISNGTERDTQLVLIQQHAVAVEHCSQTTCIFEVNLAIYLLPCSQRQFLREREDRRLT